VKRITPTEAQLELIDVAIAVMHRLACSESDCGTKMGAHGALHAVVSSMVLLGAEPEDLESAVRTAIADCASAKANSN
jgi:hypothetical protein